MNLSRYSKFAMFASACIAVSLVPLAALAQDDSDASPASQSPAPISSGMHHGHHHHMSYASHKRMMMAEFAKLNLTTDQTTKIQNLETSFEAAHPAGGVPPTRDEKRAHERSIMAILTPMERETVRHDMKMSMLQHRQMMSSKMASPEPTDSP